MFSEVITTSFFRIEQGFGVYSLGNEHIEIRLVPELGAKIISLINRRTGRQWMSWPTEELKLFRNRIGDDFSTSTLVGWDECIPTIAACSWKNRRLPDHGEVWSVPWSVDEPAFSRGELKTAVRLPVSPFHFERSLSLHRNEIHLSYRLKNLGDDPEEFLWAMHPLMPTYPGDGFDLTAETQELLGNPAWLGSLDFGGAEPACAKCYAGPLRQGQATIQNRQTGDRLTYSWDTTLNPTLGIWLTRGGWNGLHHLALEPSNGWPDALADAAAKKHCGQVPARGTLNWQVRIQIDSGEKP